MATAEKSKNPLLLFIDPDQLKKLPLSELSMLDEFVEGEMGRFYQQSKLSDNSHALQVMEILEIASELIAKAYREKVRTYVCIKMPDGSDALDVVAPVKGVEHHSNFPIYGDRNPAA
ncbi:hypothetical protein [Spirosoma sordidisoli]|uniref:Uncharacterized protein n=1 Tax=Spirosoma sordidisoli TaxID=2502893 RepID=A0A4Q2UM84_9BACT|nr:hypothetical protein [Spirosoma sordidisoli]RYC70727.1 hypothetical protein EQG79_00815 [Spirosoma sordidisoli]